MTEYQIQAMDRAGEHGEPIFRDSPRSGLIAAAPDLLAACKVAFDQTCSVGRPKDWEQLRAAIAKATGAAA